MRPAVVKNSCSDERKFNEERIEIRRKIINEGFQYSAVIHTRSIAPQIPQIGMVIVCVEGMVFMFDIFAVIGILVMMI